MANCGEGLHLHLPLDRPPFHVQLIESRRERARLHLTIGQQAADPDRHVIETTRGIEARRDRKAEIGRREVRAITPRDLEQRADAGHAASGADARESLRDEHAVVEVERHDIRHGAERDEIKPLGWSRCRGRNEPGRIERAFERDHHVKRNADARERATAEAAAWQIGIDHDVRRGQLGAWQVMIRHEHVDAPRPRSGHARHARDAVVDRDDHVGARAAPNATISGVSP